MEKTPRWEERSLPHPAQPKGCGFKSLNSGFFLV
jgi:hypothetical protein